MTVLLALINSVTTREWAILFWLLVIFIWIGTKKEIRHSLGRLAKEFFRWPILFIVLLMTLYVFLQFTILNRLQFLHVELLKDYIYWYFGFAFLSLFKINIYHPSKDIFKDLFVETLKISVLVEFLINFYTFPFIVELVFIPITVITYLLLAVSETQERFSIIKKLLNFVLSILGIVVIIYVGYMISIHFSELITITNAFSIITPVILSITFLPWLYFLNLYMVYEELFVRINFLLRKSPKLIKPLKQKILYYNHVNLRNLNIFRESSRLPLMKIKTQSDIDSLFR